MSLSARNWAWEVIDLTDTEGTQRILRPAEKLTLLCLAEHESVEHGYAFPSRERIAERTCLTTRSVSRAITVLVDVGAVTVVKKRSQDGQWPSSMYRLAVPVSYRTSDKAWLAARAKDPSDRFAAA
jgi:hypothetical protein